MDCPMKTYTTLRVGGVVDVLYPVRELKELIGTILYLRRENIPYLVIGKGSNLLVKDGGIRGVVMMLEGGLAAIEQREGDDRAVQAGAGVALTELLSHCRRKGLSGLEFLSGIPGTVGGAVIMNAGAFGHDIGSVVQEVRMVTRDGNIAVKDRSQLKFSYRALAIPEGSVIIKAGFTLDRDIPASIKERMEDYWAGRKATQPLELPSCGSVFKNPPDEYAGGLIERAGLKGTRIGGAMISPKHANFIVNMGNAKAGDILALVDLVREKVKEETGIALEPEMKVVGV